MSDDIKIMCSDGEVPVFISPVLPVSETRAASNIETKEPVYIPTGKDVHCMVMGKSVHVSNWYWENVMLPDYKEKVNGGV